MSKKVFIIVVALLIVAGVLVLRQRRPKSANAPSAATQSKILFVSNRDGNDELYVMNVDGTEITRLTKSPGVDNDPNWSPDGTKIVFRSERDSDSAIYVMNADGSNPTSLHQECAVGYCSPRWHLIKFNYGTRK